jgi:N-acetylneuraminate synthase
MSANHNGSIENAKRIIFEAKRCGADAVKIQTYTADTITLNSSKPDFQITGGLWDGQSLHELYSQASLPWEWHEELFDYAREQSITIFSSPFDKTAVDLLEKLNAPAYKIASFEAIDLPLIRYVAQTKKPMIISTGMANQIEIEEAIEAARSGGCQKLVILHCVSGYPAVPEDYNLRTLAHMKQYFKVHVGLSDHTISNTTALASIALGGCLIEKHFTLNRQNGGPDDSFSLEPDDLRNLCKDSRDAFYSLGRVNYDLKGQEKDNSQFRRSLYTCANIKKGEPFSLENIRSVRPGFGMPPKYLDQIVGKIAAQDIDFATALQKDMIKDLDF